MFLNTPDKWKRLIDVLSKEKVIGLDSEFEGVDFSKGDSCVNLAKIDVFSVAVLTKKWNPRGFLEAKGSVLPREAIPYFKELLENPKIFKAAHNSNVDVHAFYNEGIDCQGVVNTLSLARWIRPGRLTYNLEDLSQDYLGRGKTESFKDIFVIDDIQLVNKPKKVKVCLCGVPKCRKRTFPEHHKWEELRDNFVEKKVGTKIIPLHTVRPAGWGGREEGHPLWERYVSYAMTDAIRALELYDFLIRLGERIEVDIPWYQD